MVEHNFGHRFHDLSYFKVGFFFMFLEFIIHFKASSQDFVENYRSTIAGLSKTISKNKNYKIIKFWRQEKNRINYFLQHFVTSKLFEVNLNEFFATKQKLRNSVFERRTLFFKKKNSFTRWQTCYGVTVSIWCNFIVLQEKKRKKKQSPVQNHLLAHHLHNLLQYVEFSWNHLCHHKLLGFVDQYVFSMSVIFLHKILN